MVTDPQEDSNATRRYGERSHDKTGSEVMYSMPGPTGEDEPGAPESESTDQVSMAEVWETFWTWYVRGILITSMAITLIRLLQSEEVQLHVLHHTSGLFGRIARTIGGWSLRTEKAYYDVAQSIVH